jgi:hypothetical protein
MFIFIRKSPFIEYCIGIDDTFSVVKLWFITSFLSYVCKIQKISILDFMGPRWSNIRYRGSAASKRLGNTGLYNRLTDGGKVVSPTHRQCSAPQKTLFFCIWYSFLLEAEFRRYTDRNRVGDRGILTRFSEDIKIFHLGFFKVHWEWSLLSSVTVEIQIHAHGTFVTNGRVNNIVMYCESPFREAVSEDFKRDAVVWRNRSRCRANAGGQAGKMCLAVELL